LVTVPVYRCRVTSTGTHFDTNESDCEGQTADLGLLGYLLADGWTSVPLEVSSASACTMIVGTQSTCHITTIGTPTPSISESGPLPSGVSFVDNGNGTATLSGTPASDGTAATYAITITASNGVLPDATQSFTLTVVEAPAFTSAATATFTKGVWRSFTPIATGSPTPTITETGTLPSGVTFTGGRLTGKPSVIGNFPIVFTAHNGVGSDATQSFTVKVLGFHITTTRLSAATPGTPYSAQLKALGGVAPYVWSNTTSLPPGLTLTSSGLVTGTVPTTVTAGSYSFKVTVTDSTLSAHQSATATVRITIA
jgi:hypothetical protein